MNARTLRHDQPGSKAGLGLLGILLVLGLGCGSSPPAAQEPTPEPQPGAGTEAASEPADETTPDDTVAAENETAVEPTQADAPPSGQLDIEESRDTPTPAPAPEPTGKLAQLINDSEEAGRSGLYGKAHRLCSQALEIEPRQPRAVVVCAIAACNLDKARQARRYYELAPTQEQKGQIFQICRRKGIELRE